VSLNISLSFVDVARARYNFVARNFRRRIESDYVGAIIRTKGTEVGFP